MFWRAYTAFDDIDLDGRGDRTFMACVYKYYGYFDATVLTGQPAPTRGLNRSDCRVTQGRITQSGGGGASGAATSSTVATMSRLDVPSQGPVGGTLDDSTDRHRTQNCRS